MVPLSVLDYLRGKSTGFMEKKPRMDADTGLTETGKVVRRLLRHLRARAAADAKGTVKTWRIEELAAKIGANKTTVRHALNQLKSKANADLHIYRDAVTLRGPRRIEYRKIFALPPPPSTTLARQFRRHGVFLEAQLRPPTSWSQTTLKSLTDGVEQVVLTLHENLMSLNGKERTFSCIELAGQKWNRSPSNRRRANHIRHAIKNSEGLVRVIAVKGRFVSEESFKITESTFDNYYWEITEFNYRTGVFAARRTNKRVKTYSLAKTSG